MSLLAVSPSPTFPSKEVILIQPFFSTSRRLLRLGHAAGGPQSKERTAGRPNGERDQGGGAEEHREEAEAR